MSKDANSTRNGWPASPFGILLPKENGAVRFVPLFLALVIAISTSLVAYRQHLTERSALEAATESALREVSGAVEARIQAQLEAVSRLRNRWVYSGPISKSEFDAHAGALVRDFSHIRAIEWVDREFVIRWMAAEPGVQSVVGTKLGRNPRELEAYENASHRETPSMSPPIDLLTGVRGFVVAYPLRLGGEFDGFILAVYQGERVISAILEHIATGFDIEVAGATGPLWDRPGREADPSFTRATDVHLLNQVWTVSVTPGVDLVSTYLTPLPFLMVAGGVLMGGLFGSTLRGAWLGRLRNQRLRHANSRLASEVTRRTQAEEAAKATREELTSVVNSLPAYVWSAAAQPDGKLKMRYESGFIEVMTGRHSGAFESREEWIELVHPDDRDALRQTLVDLISGVSDDNSIEYRFKHLDGDWRYLRQRVRVTETAEGRRLDGITLDFTDRRQADEERAQLEARMQETQRLESLGGLAGGIAHDFNNLLVAMLGHASLARQDLASDAPAQRSLSSIERAARRAADLCRQMLAYAGMGTIDEERIDLRDVVEEMGDLLRASIPSTTVLDTELDGVPAGVEADPSQLRQVVLNLITNAAEAVGKGGGRIDVTVEAFDADEAFLTDSLLGETLEPGRYVALRVRDDGGGMDDETRRRIFEPFFSTKFQGRGLGLAAVLGIVRRCRGALHIDSAVGRGTTMTVLLRPVELTPVIAEPASAILQTEVQSGHVLVVEDDEAARDFAALVLERDGHRVSQTADGVEGLEFFEKHAHEIECVVLDLTMPRMDGVETGRRMRAIAPDVALVLSSGYPEQDAMKRFGALGITGFLQKPYEPERLTDVVRAAIRERADGLSDA